MSRICHVEYSADLRYAENDNHQNNRRKKNEFCRLISTRKTVEYAACHGKFGQDHE